MTRRSPCWEAPRRSSSGSAHRRRPAVHPRSAEDTRMNTRREFLQTAAGAMAGIAFVGCDLLGATPARAQAPARRREVVVGGKRVKTVDVHAHCAVPEA